MRAASAAMLVLAALWPAGCVAPAGNGWASAWTQIDDLRHQGLDGGHVRIAILDTGLDAGHPALAHLTDGDLDDGELVAYADFLGETGRRDAGGHGTFVAGVLAGRTPAGLASVAAGGSGLAGLAPGAHLIVGRVCRVEDCSLAAVWRGLQWALDQEPDVLSLSLGFTPAQLADREGIVDGIRTQLARAEEMGVLVVAAAGNNGRREGGVLFPASLPTVLAVGALGRDGPRATSAYGSGAKPDLSAPGEDIVGPDRGRGLVAMDGTSAAVPFVAAAAALVISGGGDPSGPLRVAALREALRSTAQAVPGQYGGHHPQAGFGVVQAADALAAYRLVGGDDWQVVVH